MVLIEEVNDELPSQERLLDAQEIESILTSAKRPSVRLQLESLAKKLRKESDALKRVEASKRSAEDNNSNGTVKAPKKAETAQAFSPAPSPVPVPAKATPPPKASYQQYHTVDRFSFDFGGYSSAFVTIYVSLPGVGSIPKDQVTCNFTKSSFDLIVKDLQPNKSYRLFKDNLEKEIDPDKCKYIIKSDEIRIKLAKIKTSEYGGYDYWSKLTDDKKKAQKVKEDPQSSIMDMMKEMYNSGDDNMKKIIGETMMKQQRGELGKDGGMGGLDDMDKFKL